MASQTHVASSNDGMRRILVVDDNAVNRKVLARQLSALGFTAMLAESASKALEALQQNHFDLLITDLRMPGISGIELAERVRAFSHESQIRVPIVLLTADVGIERGYPASGSPVDMVLVKPVDLGTLGACLKNLLPGELPVASLQTTRTAVLASQPAPAHDLFDIGYLQALVQRGVDMALLLRDWQRDVSEDLVRLNESRQRLDLSGVHSSLHRLSGSVGLVGGRLLMADLQRASVMPRMPEALELDRLAGLVQTLIVQLTMVSASYGTRWQ
ncbi:response regulator [Paraburkholderia hayleyella]|uniref:response regulator n=1 Tax=Paraburkholderia hayleyella TaxID=2152889 RepID=UPI001580DDD6|nr:response regulator [Paraburkholderia hayleyella]